MSDIHALISAIPNPVLVIGYDSRIWCANDAARGLWENDCEGRHYAIILRQPALLNTIEKGLAAGGTQNTRYLGNDGARNTTWDVNISALSLEKGQAVLLSFQDVTALEDADSMRRDFVGNVSHELRTPLTSLLGFIETLRGPASDDPAAQDRFLKIMEQEAGRMHRLVEDLLSLSRVEGVERIRPTTKISLSALCNEVAEALAPVATANNVTLDLDLPESPIHILCDREQLWQVISNLVENGVKYGGEGKTVTLKLTEPAHETLLMQDGIKITVLDQGDGISEHHIARLTERFYRVDSHRSREVGGTGLGLAIVKHIITRHRGRLHVRSKLGQGSEFTVLLPVNASLAEI